MEIKDADRSKQISFTFYTEKIGKNYAIKTVNTGIEDGQAIFILEGYVNKLKDNSKFNVGEALGI